MNRIVLCFCLIIGLAATSTRPNLGQQRPTSNLSSLCGRENALATIRQQIDLTRTFDDQLKRITVLLRAADLLWPYQNIKARAAFTEAFDLARQNFKEKGDKPRREGHLIVGVPDQRYAVITAIGKRDAAWARKLSDQMLEEEIKEAAEKSTKDDEQDTRTAEKLLGTATNLLSSDLNAALHFAQSSLRYPATFMLPAFLYKLSEINRAAADDFYRAAIAAYAAAPMDRFLYLSSFPFGNSRDVGEMPVGTSYTVPKDFVPNVQLQQLLIQTLHQTNKR